MALLVTHACQNPLNALSAPKYFLYPTDYFIFIGKSLAISRISRNNPKASPWQWAPSLRSITAPNKVYKAVNRLMRTSLFYASRALYFMPHFDELSTTLALKLSKIWFHELRWILVFLSHKYN